jgi:hypothetical protein
MNIDLSSSRYDGTWFPFKDEGVELHIRPYPQSMELVSLRGGGFEMSGAELLRKFTYCLTGWKGLAISLNGEQASCTDEVKKYIFDFDIEGIAAFVLDKVRAFEDARGAQAKN